MEDDSYKIDELPLPRPVVVDVGAHIGCFAKRMHDRNPSARIICVECCPENVPALEKNAGHFATVVSAAVTYEQEVALLNAVYPNCVSTGGSTVITRAELERRVAEHQASAQASTNDATSADAPPRVGEYWADFRPIRTLTLEDLMREHQFQRIDVLKLDCEGSEFSILSKTPSLNRIGIIVGEYHGKADFEKLVAERFAGWELRIIRDGELGTFWLRNPSASFAEFGPVEPVPTHAAQQPEQPPHAATSAATIQESKPVQPVHTPITARPQPIETLAEFKERLLAVFHPNDRNQFEQWLPYYCTLFELARAWRPNRICEIGVRAGYSAFTLLAPNPQAAYHGIEADDDETVLDTHGGFRGAWRHAEKTLAPFNAQIQIAKSQSLSQFPNADLVYVDGDHTFAGCLADLRLASRSSRRILVDDVELIPTVRQACDTFASEHPEYRRLPLDNHLTGLMLFEK